MINKIYKFEKNDKFNKDVFYQKLNEYNSVECSSLISPVIYDESGNTGILSSEDDSFFLYKPIAEYKKLTDEDFIKFCISAVEALSDLHKSGSDFGTIHPVSIYYLSDGPVRFLLPGFIPLNDESELLYYASPEALADSGEEERSGCIKDYYTLGIILLEIFTGEKKYLFNTALETFHRKMTTVTSPASGEGIFNIFNKMTALNPQERYQSASEIIHDFKYCLKKCSSSESEEASLEFHEERDFSFSVFRISCEIEGREKETALLEKSFRDTANGKSRIVFVSGYSGIGKTSLVSNFLEIIHPASGFILKGKFDQYNNSPYTGFVQIFSTLFGKLLQFDEDKLSLYRDRIIKLLGRSGKLLTDIVPVLEKITGCYSEPEVTGAVEVNNYITYMFHKLLSLFASSEKPIVIFLDDLQWCDCASFNLLKNLYKTLYMYENLLIIAAYRDNEINSELEKILKVCSEGMIDYLNIELSSLSPEQTGCILDKSFSINDIVFKEIIHEKTDGNPFLINSFLSSCFNKNYIYFNKDKCIWNWIKEEIEKEPFAGEIYKHFSNTVKKYDPDMIELLKIISCNGGSSLEKELYELSGLSMEKYEKALYLALDAGYLKFTGSDNKKISFSHDRIYQASYSLIPDSKKYIYHKNTAEYLIRSLSDTETENRIFDITDQLIRAYELKPDNEIVSDSQVLFLAEYCFRAGDRALSTAAWQPSLKYFKTALEVFSDTEWINHYDFSLKLYTRGAESALLNQEYELMEKLISRVEEKAHDILDIIPALKIRGMSYMARARLPDAVDLGKQILLLLGIKIPEKHIKLHTFIESLKVRFYLKYGTRNEHETDRKTAVLLDSLIFTFSPAYLAAPELFPIIVLKQLPLYEKNTSYPLYPFSLILYSLVLFGLSKIKVASVYAENAFKITLQNNNKFLLPKISFLFTQFLIHWTMPLSETIKFFQKGYKDGLVSGDFEYVGYTLACELNNRLYTGEYLPDFLKDADDKILLAGLIGQERNEKACVFFKLIALNLTGLTENRNVISIAELNEDELLLNITESNDNSFIALFYLLKSFIAYLYGDKEKALNLIIKCKSYKNGLAGQFSYTVFYYYRALIMLDCFSESAGCDNNEVFKEAKVSIKKIANWAKYSPENQLHRLYLVKAEYYSVKEEFKKASEYFRLAIETAGKNNFINEKALALERFALFYLSRGMRSEAFGYIIESFKAYKKWGAKRKLIIMKEQYPVILTAYNTLLPHEEKGNDVFTEIVEHDALVKATGTILSEIKQSSLFEKLLTILVQYSGAEQAYLYLTEKEYDRVSALAETVSGNITVRIINSYDFSLSEKNDYYKPIVNYTGRTLETVCIPSDGSGCESELFPNYKDISVLCMPIIRQKEKQGIILLVNSLNRSGFNRKTEQMIKVIASQASIALENARLYSELEKQVDIQNELEKDRDIQFQKLMDSEKHASIGVLLAELAHEINNPNQAILLRSSYLEETGGNIMKLAEEYYEEEGDFNVGSEMYSEFRLNFTDALSAISSSSRQINIIIKNLKNYIKSANNPEMNIVDLNEIIQETVNLASFFIKKKTDRFYFVPGDVPVILGNYQRLQQVVLNLIQNSCQSLSSRGKSISIHTEYDSQNKCVVLIIEDEGEGIEAKLLSSVKGRFFTTKENKRSTGLGLSVSDSIIKEHGGELLISSVPGKGTNVRVMLPVERND